MDKLIELQCRGESNKDKTNFLYQRDKVFLMDNHRMAAWCWAQCIDKNFKYTIIHIDKHYDTLGTDTDYLIRRIGTDLNLLTLNKYNDLECNLGLGPRKVITWDNYIPIFHYYNSDSIIKYLFFTHGIGTIPIFFKNWITEKSITDLIEKSPISFCDSANKLIINVDIDFFFVDNSRFLSDKATMKIIDSIMSLVDDPKNILTIALSPECCGSWNKSEKFISRYFGKYGIEL